MKNNFKLILLLITFTLITPSCVKNSKIAKTNIKSKIKLIPYKQTQLKSEIQKKSNKKINIPNKELDFVVKNETGKTIYITCFSYINKINFERWRWDKSDVYKLENNQSTIVNIDTIHGLRNRKHVFGALAIFNNQKDANGSIFELLNEKNRLDLDKLYKLKNKIVKIKVEKYGFKGKILDFDTRKEPLSLKNRRSDELDFYVKNETGKNLWVTCFVYQKKENDPVWRYDKTDVILLKNKERKLIDVDTIIIKYNRIYSIGYLGIFEDKEKAEKSTYELLASDNKIALGRLINLKQKEIVLEIEKYGIKNNFIDIAIKPIRKIYKK